MNIYEVDPETGDLTLSYPDVRAERSDGVSVQVSYSGPSFKWGYLTRQIYYPDGRTITLHDKLRVKEVNVPTRPATLKEQAEAVAERNGPCELAMGGNKRLRRHR